MLKNQRVGPPKDHVIETEIDEEISLYDSQHDQVMVLNATASDIWRLSDGEHTVSEIVELLASAYQVDAGDIEDEVKDTVDQFIDSGFIEDGGTE